MIAVRRRKLRTLCSGESSDTWLICLSTFMCPGEKYPILVIRAISRNALLSTYIGTLLYFPHIKYMHVVTVVYAKRSKR